MAEFGPMRIPPVHYFTHELVKQFKIPTTDFEEDGAIKGLWIRNTNAKQYKTGKGREKLYNAYNIPEHEFDKAPDVRLILSTTVYV